LQVPGRDIFNFMVMSEYYGRIKIFVYLREIGGRI